MKEINRDQFHNVFTRLIPVFECVVLEEENTKSFKKDVWNIFRLMGNGMCSPEVINTPYEEEILNEIWNLVSSFVRRSKNAKGLQKHWSILSDANDYIDSIENK